MKTLKITDNMLSADYLNSVALVEFGCTLHELTEDSQYQVFIKAVNNIVDSRIKEGERTKVSFDLFENGKRTFGNKSLIYHKKEGQVWIEKDSIESFFELKLDEQTLYTLNQRSVKIPVDYGFVHPLTEYFNKEGNPVTDINDNFVIGKDIFFNVWGSASLLINMLLNPHLTIDKKATIARQSFTELLRKYSDTPEIKIQEFIEGISSRNLAVCMEACCLIKDCLDLSMEKNK